MINNKYKTDIKNRYSESAAPNAYDVKVPSGKPVYITGKGAVPGCMDAVDAYDITWRASWADTCRNAARMADEDHDYECGSIRLKDGIHRVFMTCTGYVYVDGRIY